MRPKTHAFTLVELLVVLAILGVLMAILLPVFVSVRGAAERASCMTHLRNLGAGTHLYIEDYDDRVMPVNEEPGLVASSRTDRTWVQILLPYVTSFSIFWCPANTANPANLSATFDQDLVPGDTDSQYYTASLRSNYGYNFQYLAPIVMNNGQWIAEPKNSSQVTDPSSTLLFVDSVWTQNAEGEPIGGGNWLVTPPCRYYAGPGHVDSFTGAPMGNRVQVFTTAYGWTTQSRTEEVAMTDGGWGPGDGASYGNSWPWHFGHMNAAMVDGSVHSLTPAQLTAGCDVKNAWAGLIRDRSSYLWDVR